MKKILFIIILFPLAATSQLTSFIVRGDTLFSVNPSTGAEIQLTKLVPPMIGQSGKVLSNNGSNYTWVSNSASISWGDITGTLSGQTDLQTALNAKQSTISTGTTAQYFKGDLSLGTYSGYAINVQALTSSPTDAQTIYFGKLPKAPVTAAATSKIYVRNAGTITGAEIYCYSGTAGTNESWSLYIRVNNTTDYLIGTLSVNTSERVFTNNGLSISLSAGDYFEIKSVNPTWATNPLTTIFGGYIKIN